jgi:AhpD family alkylhydroperoxidase
MIAEFKTSLVPVTDEAATGEAKTILDASIALRGRASNMYRAMANSEGLLSTYAHGYEAFRQGSGFSSHEQEVVLLTISRENGCHYCSAVHSFVADKAIKLEPSPLSVQAHHWRTQNCKPLQCSRPGFSKHGDGSAKMKRQNSLLQVIRNSRSSKLFWRFPSRP